MTVLEVLVGLAVGFSLLVLGPTMVQKLVQLGFKWTFWEPLYQKSLNAIAEQGLPLETPFALGDGFQAQLVPVIGHFLNRHRGAESQGMLLVVTSAVDFPFAATYYRAKPGSSTVIRDPDTIDQRFSFWKNRRAFYSFLDAPTRAFFDNHECLIEDATCSIVLVDFELDKVRDVKHIADALPALLTQVHALLARCLEAQLLADYPQRLGANEPVGLRQRALREWLIHPDAPDAVVPTPPAANQPMTHELLWYSLDLGFPLDTAKLDFLCQTERGARDEEACARFEKPLALLLFRHQRERRPAWILPLLSRPPLHPAVLAVLPRFPDPAYNAILIDLFSDQPNDPAPLQALFVADQAEVVDFLTGILSRGPLAAQKVAAAHLATHGNRAAMAALDTVRRRVSRKHRTDFDDAYLRLRQKLGPRRDVGALSLIQADSDCGTLSQADPVRGALSRPSPHPSESNHDA